MDFNIAGPVLVIITGYLALLLAGKSFRSEVNSILRADYNLLFFSILVGISLVFVSELLIALFVHFGPGIHFGLFGATGENSANFPLTRSFFPFRSEEYDDAYVISVFVVSVALVILMRIFFNLSSIRRKTTKLLFGRAFRRGEYLICYLQDAIDNSRLVMLTLISGKVYVGCVAEPPITEIEEKDSDISFIPIYSGHRDSKTRKVVSFEIRNRAIYLQLEGLDVLPELEDESRDEEDEIYRVHIPLNQLESAGAALMKHIRPLVVEDDEPDASIMSEVNLGR